jgi:hypothetical protein
MLRRFLITAVTLAVSISTKADAQTPITKTSSATFAIAADARELLTVRDDFVDRMSPFDRAARLKSGDEVSVEQYLDFVGKQTLDWTAAEQTKVEAALAAIRPKLVELAVPLPETVHLVRTTGHEEGGAAYTRGTAIVLPSGELAAMNDARLRKTLAHELFHVLSRAQPELKEQLYAAIGFAPCGELPFPESLADRRITNPDAPRNDHAIEVDVAGERRWVVPVLYSRTPKYDARVGGEFFNYLEFRLLVVDRDEAGAATASLVAGEPQLVEPGEVGNFFEQVGRNTQYIIHPEEILADNFALLVLGETSAKSPEVLRKMESIVRDHAKAATPDKGE